MREKVPSHLRGQSLQALADLLEAGETTSQAITQAYLDSIQAQNGRINAYLSVNAQEALAQAAAADQRRDAGQPLSPVDGIPIAIKDNILRQGQPCTCASTMLADFVSPYDATVIERIKGAGMPILGSLNMDEFAMGGSNETSAFGPTRNPWNEACVPGGSSGGSAAAVAAGMAPVALGSDTGGSIRQPASFCGVVGVKPAYGTVSRYGLVAFGSSLDQIGVLAKTTGDAALVMNVIAGGDPRDMTSDPALATDFAAHTQGQPLADATGITLGVPVECLGQGLHPEVRQALEAAVAHWQALGAQVRQVSLPTLPYALPAYYVISSAEASSNLARYDGVRYGYRAAQYADLDELYRNTRQQAFGMEVKRRILLGTFALSSGYQDEYYRKATKARSLLRQEAEATLADCHALLMPVAPTPAYPLGAKAQSPMEMYMGDLYTVPANITGLPALSLPLGLSREGLPIGMGLMGRRQGLAELLGLAQLYEGAYPAVAPGQHPYDRALSRQAQVKGGKG